MDNLEEFQKLVIANASKVQGLSIGERAPDFILPNALGKKISLSELSKTTSVIIKFYRGEWCPLCNLDLMTIQKDMSTIKSLNATLVAISPQQPNDALTIIEKNNLCFEVLSDSEQKVIEAYNLKFDPGEDYHKRRDLTLLNGNGLKTLPIPATYIIDKEQIIRAAHVEANYTKRMTSAQIIDVLKEICKNT